LSEQFDSWVAGPTGVEENWSSVTRIGNIDQCWTFNYCDGSEGASGNVLGWVPV
jgi:hypothetical protein